MSDVSANENLIELEDTLSGSFDSNQTEENDNEIQSIVLSSSDSSNTYDYSSDFQNIFGMQSLMIAVTIGGLCFLAFAKGFKS